MTLMPFFADISFSTEGVAVITVLVGGLVTAVVALWKQNRDVLKQQLEDKDKQLAALSNKTEALEKLALKATAILEREYNEGLREQGLPPLEIKEKVDPEHHSPPTVEQRDVADVQTLKARIEIIEGIFNAKHKIEGTPSLDKWIGGDETGDSSQTVAAKLSGSQLVPALHFVSPTESQGRKPDESADKGKP